MTTQQSASALQWSDFPAMPLHQAGRVGRGGVERARLQNGEGVGHGAAGMYLRVRRENTRPRTGLYVREGHALLTPDDEKDWSTMWRAV